MSDTDSYRELRERMIADQIEARGIHDPRVLLAMRTVPREAFVPADLQSKAYADGALPIDCQQTISQPLIVAMMSAALQLRGFERVLEIGTGSGYQAAVLAQLAAEVITLERHETLSRTATELLKELGYDNVITRIADGTLGCAEFAPFDRIMVTAGATEIPPALFDQLAEGGRMIIPLGEKGVQTLTLVHKRDGKPVREDLTGCRFVPLIADEG